jgi:predicted acylesterase/phospholipase RssA
VKNLVIEGGGGARGIAYTGAISELEHLGLEVNARKLVALIEETEFGRGKLKKNPKRLTRELLESLDQATLIRTAREAGLAKELIAECAALNDDGVTVTQPSVMSYVSRFAGASAGAMVAMQLALGYSADEITEIATEIDMKRKVEDGIGSHFCCRVCSCCNICCGVVTWFCCNWCCCQNRTGMHAGDRLSRYIGEVIAAKTGNPNLTFKELYDATGGVELCVVVCNLTCMASEEWHVKTTPNKPIRDAVRVSMGMPGVLNARREKGFEGLDLAYVDGGVLCNFPLHVRCHYHVCLFMLHRTAIHENN